MSALLLWAHALGWGLLHFLWQGALIAVAYAALRLLLPARCSGLRYGLGLVALAVSALCVPLTVWWLSPASQQAPVLLANAVSMLADDSAVAGSDLAGLVPWLVLLWVLGVGLSASRAVVQWRLLDRVATSMAVRNADLDRIMRDVLRRFDGMRDVVALVSPHLDTPTLIGWIKPVIVLPSALVLGFPRQHLELILIHELGHLRRYDHLVNLGQVVIETLLFYHPAVHWISREVRHEREIRCDELVLGMCRGEGRAYATALAALEDLRQLSPRLSLAASGGSLLDRIRRIAGLPGPKAIAKPRSWAVWLPALAAVITGAAMLLHVHEQQLDAEEDSLAAAAEVELTPLNTPALLVPSPSLAVELPQTSWPEPIFAALHPAIPADEPETPSEPLAERLATNPAVEPTGLNQAQVMSVVDSVESEWVAQSAPPPAQSPAALSLVPSSSTVALAESVTEPAVEHPAPRLLHRVAPAYPGAARAQSRGTVELEFSIDASGAVRDIEVVSVDTPVALLRAAQRALRQWRFEPGSGADTRGERLRQEFVFAGIDPDLGGAAEDGEANCLRSTGSKLCRSSRASPEVQIQVIPQVADVSRGRQGANAGS